ncbi:hypothetical protein [Streptomyces hygroscopicus]|uniref:hypothetical protein n=1 Tax=Streptomyces hygroscopicus TaxID=1912 RepID=UPI0033C40DCA
MYGIDVEESRILSERSWRWLRIRILGLLSADSRTARHFAPPEPKTPKGGAR